MVWNSRHSKKVRNRDKKIKFKKIILLIDIINDIEHNTSLFLKDHTNFGIDIALSYKFYATPNEIIKRCSRDIKKLWRIKI